MNANASSVNPNDKVEIWNDSKPETYFEQLGLEDGYLYYDDENAALASSNKYYLRLNGKYYSLTAALFNQLKGDQVGQTSDGTPRHPDYYYKYSINQSGISCTHTHDATCYSCGMEEHDHSDDCGTLTCGLSETPKKYMSDIQPDSELWDYERSDTVTVAADGSSVLNVYFTRKTFTLQFRDAYSNSNDYGTISARWGKNIADEYNAIVKKAGSSFWSENRDASGPWTNYIGVMPQRDITYYRYMPDGYGTSTMTYYAEDLNGTYQVIFTLTFKGTGYNVTDEDRYEFEGFTYDHGTNNGEDCDGAAFYYKRNTYSLEFYSASQNATDRQHTVKYQAPLSPYAYTPTAKPDTLEQDAFFVGWYQNPECTGEPYDLATHTMPNANKALYAKWVNGLYTVSTYTDDSMQTPYTYEGYTGEQKNIEKYTLATAPKDPSNPPYVFIGWFYREGDTEKPFSFTMPITRDYALYPKYSTLVSVTYLVHYYKKGTTERIADDRTNSVMIGQTVTEKAKMGTELNLLSADEQGKYYPEKTSTSEIIRQDNQEIIFYYTEATSGRYTVYYQDAKNNDLREPVTKTTASSTVTEQYVPIPGYAPDQYSITLDLSSDPEQNKITFIYEPTRTTLTIQKSGWEAIDENQTFLFHIQGIEDTTEEIDLTVTVHGNGKTTITDLPVGKYRVTEMTGWSWRYAPAGNAQEITLAVDGTTLPFANQRAKNNWLDGDSFHVNLFGANP